MITLDDDLREAFRIGFMCSSEGFNGEYPFEGVIPDDARGQKWLDMRERNLAALIDKHRREP